MRQAVDDPRKCLVYPLMRGGSLGDRLRLGTAGACAALSARQRVDVAAGTARGLAELHSQGIIHRDVKSTNILLDESCTPLVADMGLCRVLRPAATHTTTRRMGTDGYIDPEYSETLELREQSDVYSFGVVLLELLSNQAAYTEGLTPPGLVGRFRQHLRAARPVEAFSAPQIRWPAWMACDLGAVAEQCLKLPGVQRPKMRDVVRMLERIVLLARAAEVEALESAAAVAGAAQPAPDVAQPQQAAPDARAAAVPPTGAPLSKSAAAATAAAAAAAIQPSFAGPGALHRSAPVAAAPAGGPPPLLLNLARSADSKIRAGLADSVESLRRLHELTPWAGLGSSCGGAEAFQALRANAAGVTGGFEATLTQLSALGVSLAGTDAGPRSTCTGGLEQLLSLVLVNGGAAGAGSATDGAAPPGVRPSDVPGLEAVIGALRAHALANGAQPGGAGSGGSDALLALADGADVHLRAATAGGIEAIVQAMRVNGGRPTVLTWGCWALQELALKSATNKAKVAALGGLDACVASMGEHPLHVGVQEQGCALLAVVSAASGDCATAALRSSGVEAAVRALRQHVASHAGVAAHACWALAHMAAGEEEAGRRAREAGAPQLCQLAQSSHKMHRGVQAHALLALANMEPRET